MTVKELIENLNKMPQDATVEVETVCGYENSGGEVSTITLNKEGIVVIFG